MIKKTELLLILIGSLVMVFHDKEQYQRNTKLPLTQREAYL